MFSEHVFECIQHTFPPSQVGPGGGLPYIHIYTYKNDEPAPTKFFPRFFQLFFTEDTARGPGKQDSPPSRTTCLSPDFETSRLVAWNPSVASCCWQAVFLKKKTTTLNGIIVGKFYEEITPYIYIYTWQKMQMFVPCRVWVEICFLLYSSFVRISSQILYTVKETCL